MNWEQKLHALQALAECSLIMRKPGDWIFAELPLSDYIVIRSYGDDRKAVRWNGFMWEEVKE